MRYSLWFLTILLFALSSGLAYAIDIDACQTLTQGQYILTQDITVDDSVVDGNCFIFSENDISLDCQGHSLFGTEFSASAFIMQDVSSITINNCTVTGFSLGSFILDMSNVQNSIFNDIRK